jgi:hypothetical protein
MELKVDKDILKITTNCEKDFVCLKDQSMLCKIQNCISDKFFL